MSTAVDAVASTELPRSRSRVVAVRCAAVALWTLLALALLAYAARNLPNRGIWYDEAVQLHISLGDDPFGPLGQPPGGLARVRAVNGRANLDPGGFSVLLHGWLRIGHDLTWVRALPFLFAVAGTVALALLGARWGRAAGGGAAAAFSLLGVGLLWLDPMMLLEATEVRAYSLEAAGILCAFWALDRFLERGTVARGLIAGAAIATAMLARYSGFLFALAALAATTVTLARGAPAETTRMRRWLGSLRRSWPVAVAPAASALGVAVLCGEALIGRIRWRSGELVGYLDPYLAKDRPPLELIRQGAENLLGPWGLPSTVALAVAVWAMWSRDGARRAGWDGERTSLRDASSFLVFATAGGTVVLSAALWRYHPWDLAERWSFYLHVISIACVLRLGIVFFARAARWTRGAAAAAAGDDVAPAAREADARRSSSANDRAAPRWTQRTVATVATLAVILVVAASVRAAIYRRDHPGQVVDALAWLARHPEEEGTIAVSTHTAPSIRYLCERERLEGCAGYPDRFDLPVDGREEALVTHHGLAITSEPVHAVRARLTPAQVEDEGLPHNLIRIVQPGG